MTTFSIVKLRIPEKHIARRLQTTTSHPVNFSMSSITPILRMKIAEQERSYVRNNLKNRLFPRSDLVSVLSLQM